MAGSIWTGVDDGPMATRKGTKKLESSEKAAKPGLLDSLLSVFRRPASGKNSGAAASAGKDGKKRSGSSGTRKLSPGGGKRGVGAQKRTTALPQAAPSFADDSLLEDRDASMEQDLLGAVDGDLFSFDLGENSGPGFFENFQGGEPAPFPPQSPPPAPPRPAPADLQRPSVAPAPAGGSGLFAPEGVERDLDSLFDSFEPAAASPPARPVVAPAAPASGLPASAPQRAPLSPVTPPAAAAAPSAPVSAAVVPSSGATQDGLVSIGKLLVDQNTLKRIIDNAEKRGAGMYSTTTIISNSRGADLDLLLQRVDGCEGVQGSLIVGRDGLVIASSLPPSFERELVGAIASSMLTNLDVQGKKMKVGSTRMALLDTEEALVMLVALQLGVLVVMAPSLVGLDLTAILSVLAGDPA